MASAEQIKALLRSYSEGDDDHFFSVANQLAASEAKNGHNKVAKEIRDIIKQARSNNLLSDAVPRPTLIVRPKKELVDLLSVSYPKTRFSDMALADNILEKLGSILKEQFNWEKLKAYGLSPKRKILFTGPPGCGKTMSASALAGELKLPLFVVRLDGLITKYMGESIAKLRLIFDAMQDTRAVYLFDEFDSIGTHRGFLNDVGEIKRVLSSFLMYIERDDSNSVIIAATNYPQSLDYALFRRFDELMEFELPSPDLISQTIKNQIAGFKSNNIDYNELGKVGRGLSFADITMVCHSALKEAVINNKNALETSDLLTPLSERVKFQNKYIKNKNKD